MKPAALLVALALASAAPVRAAGAGDALAEASGRVAGAVAALEVAATEDKVAALAGAMAAYETALAGMRGAVFGAEARERELTRDLQVRRADIARMLAALEALGDAPAPAQALHPAGPLGAARAAAMRGWLTPALEAEAATLAARLREIETERTLRARGLEDLGAGLAELERAREALLAALALGESEPVTAAAASAIPAALLRESESLSAFADGLAAFGGTATAPTGAAATPALRWPVAGRTLYGFREPDAAGVRRPGLLLQAPPLSLVTAPADATVRYAGPFLDYGYVVVLEPRADVLIVLAGLARLETRSGAAVRAGALLGLLGGRALDAQEYLMLAGDTNGATPAETLYIEIRYGQGPVDPASWFGN